MAMHDAIHSLNYRGQNFGGDGCAHTARWNGGVNNPWWMVDLGAVYQIDSVRIYNRDEAGTLFRGGVHHSSGINI